jgi:DNA-binding MarR family transcriptional regulator
MASPRSAPPTVPALPCACAGLRRAARAVTRLYDAALRPTGLHTTQFTLLQTLAVVGRPLKHGALGELLALDTTTLSRTLRPLERDKWIRTFPGADGRQRYIELTPVGRRVLDRATPAWERAQNRLQKALGPRDWATLASVTTAAVIAARE